MLFLIYSAKYIAKERASDGKALVAVANKNTSSSYYIGYISYRACCAGYFGGISVSLGLGWVQWKDQIRENAVGLDATAHYTSRARCRWVCNQPYNQQK